MIGPIARRRLAGAAMCALGFLANPPDAEAERVDLALVLAVDVSTSINFVEFGLQMDAYAAAFRAPEIVRAIRGAGRDGVAVTLIQWAGDNQQTTAVDWIRLTDAKTCEEFASALDQMPRFFANGATSIAGAIEFAMASLAQSDYQGARRVIDISGDGPNNQQRSLRAARDRALAEKITINGLAIVNEELSLAQYYESNVIGGPGAFVMTAVDFEDFAEALRQKLLREISGVPVADLPRPVLVGAGERP